jgi:hypothetical protein
MSKYKTVNKRYTIESNSFFSHWLKYAAKEGILHATDSMLRLEIASVKELIKSKLK